VPLRKAGEVAPDFTAVTADGRDVKLSDFAGHVIVLDFWATWCGPCQAAMPHFQKAYETFKDQGVVFYGSCTADVKSSYDRWVAANRDKYTFLTAFDPAGRSPDKVSHKLYGVEGIPTQFVIGADGRIVDVIVGYDGPGDHRLEHALAKAGVKVDLSKYQNDLPDPDAPAS
jgi:peroxiredoxin